MNSKIINLSLNLVFHKVKILDSKLLKVHLSMFKL